MALYQTAREWYGWWHCPNWTICKRCGWWHYLYLTPTACEWYGWCHYLYLSLHQQPVNDVDGGTVYKNSLWCRGQNCLIQAVDQLYTLWKTAQSDSIPHSLQNMCRAKLSVMFELPVRWKAAASVPASWRQKVSKVTYIQYFTCLPSTLSKACS